MRKPSVEVQDYKKRLVYKTDYRNLTEARNTLKLNGFRQLKKMPAIKDSKLKQYLFVNRVTGMKKCFAILEFE
jgi:hypothetical protein